MTRLCLCLILILLAGCQSLQVDPISDGYAVHVRVPIPVEVERRVLMTSRDQMWKHIPWCCHPPLGDNKWYYRTPLAIRNMGGPDVPVLRGVQDYFDLDGDGDVDLWDIMLHIVRGSHTVAFRAARICRQCPERCDGVPGYTCPEE